MTPTILQDLLPFHSAIINSSITPGHGLTSIQKIKDDVHPKGTEGTTDRHHFFFLNTKSTFSIFQRPISRIATSSTLHTDLLAVTVNYMLPDRWTVIRPYPPRPFSRIWQPQFNHKTRLRPQESRTLRGSRAVVYFLHGRSFISRNRKRINLCSTETLHWSPTRLGTQAFSFFSFYTHSLGTVKSSHGFSYHCYADDAQLIFSFAPSDTMLLLKPRHIGQKPSEI